MKLTQMLAGIIVCGLAAGLLIALAVAGLLAVYGWIASDPSFWTNVFGG